MKATRLTWKRVSCERSLAQGDRRVVGDRRRSGARAALDHAGGPVARGAPLAGPEGSSSPAGGRTGREAPFHRAASQGRGQGRGGGGAHLRRANPDARGPRIPGRGRGSDPREPPHGGKGL